MNDGKEIFADCEAVSLAAPCSFGLFVEESPFFSLEERNKVYTKINFIFRKYKKKSNTRRFEYN